MASCSNKVSIESDATSVSSNSSITPQPTSTPKVEKATDNNLDTSEGKSADTVRKEAGLSIVLPLDFTRFTVNKRLIELLDDANRYNNDDYKNGILVDREVLVSERYKDNIIDDIKIGTDIDHVRKVLGEPNITTNEGFVFYKTKDYYLGFKGSSKVEYAILTNRSIPKDKDILALIAKELKSENNLATMLASNQDIVAFFDESGHINGGGWYAHSYCGIEMVQFDSNTLTIYNNYEGDLSSAKDFEYDVKYVDSDYQVNKAINTINEYIAENKDFDTLGVLSPSGKLKSIYNWEYSMSHYFKIRTLDNSKPDFKIAVPAGDYKWLTDDYILYLNAWFTEPHIVRVSEEINEDIDIMHNLGVYDKDASQKPSFNFSIKNVDGKIITLYDSENNKEYKVEYSIGSNGIEVKMAD